MGEDLEILADLAARAARRWQGAQDYDVEGLAAQFADTLRAELDYLAEARNVERFATGIELVEDLHAIVRAHRLVMGVLAAAFIDALATLTAARPPRRQRWPGGQGPG